METALSSIKLMPASKAELSHYVAKAKSEILSGYYNPLEVAGMLKSMEEVVKALRDDKEIREAIQDEADKYKEKTIRFETYHITKTERKTKDFTGVCPVLDSLNNDLERTKNMIKARQAVIEAGVNPETGETFPPVPFTTSTIISVSFK
jgi:hypothetical protein